MGSEQSSHASVPSKEEQKVICTKQIIGVRGREEEKVVTDNNREDSFVEINRERVESFDDFEDSESDEYESDDESVDESYNEDDTERRLILEDAAALKTLAVSYAHPEYTVTVDGAAFGRNFFSRASAVEQETCENAEERAQILADAAALKKLAVDYAHPELKVSTTSTVFGRNCFSRASAVKQETCEDAEERAQILADAAALKKLAIDYAHPELKVSTTATACGRNYFSRASAVERETFEDAEERAQILADVAALKKLAIDYAHPELSVTNADGAVFGRNYFSRASAVSSVAMTSENTTSKKIVVSKKSLVSVDSDKLVTKVSSSNKNVVVDNKMDESTVKRSPSSVVLYGLGDDGNAY